MPTQALNLDPKLPAAWVVRGTVQAGRPASRAQALADYLRALGYAPRDRAILREIADLYRQLNQAGAGPADPANPGRHLLARRRAGPGAIS